MASNNKEKKQMERDKTETGQETTQRDLQLCFHVFPPRNEAAKYSTEIR